MIQRLSTLLLLLLLALWAPHAAAVDGDDSEVTPHANGEASGVSTGSEETASDPNNDDLLPPSEEIDEPTLRSYGDRVPGVAPEPVPEREPSQTVAERNQEVARWIRRGLYAYLVIGLLIAMSVRLVFRGWFVQPVSRLLLMTAMLLFWPITLVWTVVRCLRERRQKTRPSSE